jgi:hypothetical protein
MSCYAEPLQESRHMLVQMLSCYVTALTSLYVALWALRWESTDMA